MTVNIYIYIYIQMKMNSSFKKYFPTPKLVAALTNQSWMQIQKVYNKYYEDNFCIPGLSNFNSTFITEIHN